MEALITLTPEQYNTIWSALVLVGQDIRSTEEKIAAHEAYRKAADAMGQAKPILKEIAA